MNTRTILLFVLTLFTQLINGAVSSAHVISKTVENLPDVEVITVGRNGSDEPTLFELQRSVVFSPTGLTCYFKHIYSCRKYAEDVLPYKPFKHVNEFLQHGINAHQGRVYTKAVVRLFDKKFKAVSFVSASELISFLGALPEVLAKDLVRDSNKKCRVKNLVRFELENGFDELKRDPDLFLDTLAEKIVSGNVKAEEISRSHLCTYVTKFVDLCVSKAMWSAQSDAWGQFTQLGHALTDLHTKNIILNSDALDDCMWSLVTRFAHFVSLWGSDLSPEFYQKAGDEIRNGVDFLDAVPEQESTLRTKVDYLKEVLVEGAIKANAKQNGIISETVLNRRS